MGDPVLISVLVSFIAVLVSIATAIAGAVWRSLERFRAEMHKLNLANERRISRLEGRLFGIADSEG